MKLSICVITMNRAEQLKEALESCLSCILPKKTEFVIIDNASTDDTERTVHLTLKNAGYSYYYEKLAENLGVGGGRNYAYGKSCGEYAYMLDDDAIVDFENQPDFFLRAVRYLDENQKIVTLTTQIYDTSWKKNRCSISGPKINDNLYKCLMFCGGSHFLRKSFYTEAPYLPNKYGYEEIPPSLRAINVGKLNAFCPDLLIIHKPAINKWNYDDEKNHALLIKGIALPYAIKKMMYPRIFLPILFLAYTRRFHKYLNMIPNAQKSAKKIIREISVQCPIDYRIKIRTVIKIFKDFGLSTF